MKSLTTFIAITFLMLSTTACSQQHTYHSGNFFGNKTVKASKNYVTKDIKVENFTKLNVAGSPDVTYTQKSGKPKVEVYTSDNIVDLLDIRVKDNTLYVGFKKNVSVSYDKLKIRISTEKLNGISVAGSGNVELANGLKTDDLKISVAGSGDINGSNISCTDLNISIAGSGDINSSNINCDNLKVSVAGSGDMKLSNVTATSANASIAGSGTATLSGNTQEAEYSVAGSGDLFASDFIAKKAFASVAGSGDIKCHATDFLKVRTSGSGSVGYKGNPELDYPKKGLYKL
ncbi:head GIN domain-containing protein [Bacteroides helcogenes]|uniref:Lipoprotein n=1 Tax=Bacteroides helcogenes (strain ATCC 35417 / DSM 20613 / JCM 6297 / CCUG 15421 / P 36-108) TaxID=693979 RepID=E6SW26_BACT6|nr:head GIN domain-containing protein [Bacteroides helcogenes]ADV42551.1 putative lipoprotein [Bacteroides helcogenes P 36-108]MDY5237688.1 head GIN domain-containing protein [Bacteroides helcogenes]